MRIDQNKVNCSRPHTGTGENIMRQSSSWTLLAGSLAAACSQPPAPAPAPGAAPAAPAAAGSTGGRQGADQGRHPPLALRDHGHQRDVAAGRGAHDHRRDQRGGRRARAQARAGGRRPGLQLAALRREGARPDPEPEGRRDLRLLDLGLAQVGAAGVRRIEWAALLPGAVRGRGVVLERLLHGRRARTSRRSRRSST